MPDNPLISFVLIAYKQEQFIREAVEGALAQTYSPLEIILSDDCSPDGTFEIMREMATAYQGLHTIILNRNPKNLGIAGHVNRVMDLAQGELMVMAAGDDVSLPERAAQLTREWVAHGRPSGIASAAIIMDATGRGMGVAPATGHHTAAEINQADPKTLLSFLAADPGFLLLGCTAAWSKDLWNTFGPLADNVTNEDWAFTFRSCFVKGIRTLGVSLVRYRQHDGNILSPIEPHALTTPGEYLVREENSIRKAKAYYHLYGSLLADLEQAISKGLATRSQTIQVLAAIEKGRHKEHLAANWWDLGFLCKLKSLGMVDERAEIKVLRLLPNKMAYATCRSFTAGLKRWLHIGSRT